MLKYQQTSSVNDESQEVRFTIALIDVEPRPLYHNSNTVWRPERIAGHWSRSRVNGHAWSEWQWSARVIGPKLKRDGSPYAGREYRDYIGFRSEWIEAVESTRPGVELPVPFAEPTTP